MISPKIRRRLGSIVPTYLESFLGGLLKLWRDLINSRRSTQDIFDEVYRKGLWGGSLETLCSGHGSNKDPIIPYAMYINDFLKRCPSLIPVWLI